jgi:MFS family permease
VPFFYGWLVIGLSFLTTLTGAGIRSMPTVLIHPFELEFGWSRAAISSAISLNLLLFGVAGPVGGWFLDRFGPRRVMTGALSVLVIGVSATTVMSQLWQLVVLWGVVVGLGAGAVGSVLSATFDGSADLSSLTHGLGYVGWLAPRLADPGCRGPLSDPLYFSLDAR